MRLKWSRARLPAAKKDAAAAGTVSPEPPLSYTWHTPSPDQLSFVTHNDVVWQPGAHEHQRELSNIDGFDAPTSVSGSNSRPSDQVLPPSLSRQPTLVASPVQNPLAFPRDVQPGQVRLVENASSERIPTFFSSEPSQLPIETQNPTVTVTSSEPTVPSAQNGVFATTNPFIPLINGQATSYNSSPQPIINRPADPPPYQPRVWDPDDMAEAYDGIEILSPPIEKSGHQRYPASSTGEPSLDGAPSIPSPYRPALVTVSEPSPAESSPYGSPMPPTDARPLAYQQGPQYIVDPTFPDRSRPNIRQDHSYSSLSTASPSGSYLTPATRPPYVSPGQYLSQTPSHPGSDQYLSPAPSHPGSDQYLSPTTSHLGSEQYLSPTTSHAGSGSIYATSSTSSRSSRSGYPSRLPERLVMPTPLVMNSAPTSGSHYHAYSLEEDALQPSLYSDRSPSVPLLPRSMSAEPSPMAQNIPMPPNPNKPRVLRKRASVAAPLKRSSRSSSIPPNMPLDFSADIGLRSMTIPSSQNAEPPSMKKKGKRLTKRRTDL